MFFGCSSLRITSNTVVLRTDAACNIHTLCPQTATKIIKLYFTPMFLYVQSLLLKCRTQHSGWRWHPLVAQVPAGKSNAIPPLHGSLQLSKITKKNNHVPYNMRCWERPSSSTHFWHLFRKCAFTCINLISEIQSISSLIPAFNSFNVWGVCNFYLWGHLKNKLM